MGEKAHQLFERSLAAGFASVLAESVAEAVYDPKEHISSDDLELIQDKATQTVDQRLGADAPETERLAALKQEEFRLMKVHLAPHKESAKKLGQIATTVTGALTNNETMLQAMFGAATRALNHNFMEHVSPEESMLMHEREVKRIQNSTIAKSAAVIFLAGFGITIAEYASPGQRGLKCLQFVYRGQKFVRSFNNIKDAINFVNTKLTTGAAQIAGTAYQELIDFGNVLEREGLSVAASHAYIGCENWVKENITQGLDLDGSAALDPEGFGAYDGPKESVFEKKSTKDSEKHGTQNTDRDTTKEEPGGSGGGSGGDKEPDEKERKDNCTKSKSPVWKSLRPYKGKTRTDAKGKKYQWDHTHKDIEVYNNRNQHLGSMNPKTGEMYKPAVPGRKLGV